MSRNSILRNAMIVATLLGTSTALVASPPSRHTVTKASLQAQIKDTDAKIAAAHAQNSALQVQVSHMEQQNAANAKQLQARDAEIAALQRKLQAAGVPASANSAGHQP